MITLTTNVFKQTLRFVGFASLVAKCFSDQLFSEVLGLVFIPFSAVTESQRCAFPWSYRSGSPSVTLLEHFCSIFASLPALKLLNLLTSKPKGLNCAVNLPQLILVALCLFKLLNGRSLSSAWALGSHQQLANGV